MSGRFAIPLVIASLAGVMGGCWATSEPGVLSHDPVQRRNAIVQAAASNDDSAVRDLITRLDSQDAGERLLAIKSLESITGVTCGYDYAASPSDRADALARWTRWAREHGYAGHVPKAATKGTDLEGAR